jgi:hypothetical protein
MPGVLTWRRVLVFLIRRAPTSATRIHIRAIAAENPMRFVPIQSSAGCITNTLWCRPLRDRISADYMGCKGVGALQIRIGGRAPPLG